LGNEQIARCLEEIAGLLQAQDASVFRVRAYRTAAETLRRLDGPVVQILDREGVLGLVKLPGIGDSLGRSIEELCRTGRLGLLQRLRGDGEAERLFQTVSGIGPELAARIHEQLGIETLEDLEDAAYDGRLAKIPGMAQKRLRAVRETLAARFQRSLRSVEDAPVRLAGEAPIAELIDVDQQYRQKAKAGKLKRIAPRRFNPTGEAWLPVLHTRRGSRQYTALYSNTPLAHELDKTRDWVVIYRDDHNGRGQWTAVTGRYGALRGRRVIRGREAECEAYYAQHPEYSRQVEQLASGPKR
ncbi:MAG TPA: helix-hairpin-helix domain-containing protein, partial [Gemmataceae bacterium]|nr:helix-hairpin-helix domain-containing protein [Gemmataceae bacterium]